MKVFIASNVTFHQITWQTPSTAFVVMQVIGICFMWFNRAATEHFLTALSLQQETIKELPETEHSLMSDNIWTTMRMTISLMGRQDLLPSCDNKELNKLKEEFNISTWMKPGVVTEEEIENCTSQLPGILKLLFLWCQPAAQSGHQGPEKVIKAFNWCVKFNCIM